MTKQRIHVIAIGGGVMHSMALALKAQGHEVSGSDDVIYSPSKEALEAGGLYPPTLGWDPERITKDMDFVLLGMHAQADNPELARAQALGIPIYDYPTYARRLCANKQRIVITGSYGKTTLTAMVMHVLNHYKRPFDYLIGAPLKDADGLKTTTKLSHEAPAIVIEGDEYPASRLNLKPKLNLYDHHIGLLTGISWDHVNFYPNWEDYVQIFERFAENTPKAGVLIYNAEDDITSLIGKKPRTDVTSIGYECPNHVVEDERTYLVHQNERIPLHVFGRHNLMNIEGARLVLKQMAVSRMDFYEAISSFKGAYGRLHFLGQVGSGRQTLMYRDFAHAPAKARATVAAMRMQFPKTPLVAALELCTYSSLTDTFLPQYKDTLNEAQVAIVYVNPEISQKRSQNPFTHEQLKRHFNRHDLIFIQDKNDFASQLKPYIQHPHHFLFMSSSNFGGLDIKATIEALAPEPKHSY